MQQIAVISAASAPALLQEDLDAAAGYQAAEKAPATRRAYRNDLRIFASYCANRGVDALPALPQVVGAFLSAEAAGGAKASTLGRRLAAIRYAHLAAGFESPTASEELKMIMRGIRRTIGTAPVKKAPALAGQMKDMLALCPATMKGKRDRALLALGFAGAFRRSELVALQVADLVEVADGLLVKIRWSKTDQEGQGQEIAIPRGARLRPVEAVQDWLVAAGITAGPIFRRVGRGGRVSVEALAADSVPDVVKAYALATGLEPGEYAAHSLRAGFLTSGAESGASIFKLMEVSRHKSVDTLRGYVRRTDLFRDHAGAAFL
jgi:site-specific recombinase XerD